MTDSRPNPDKLLELVNSDRAVSSRGHLKIFFGASAGVGKTYAMLSEAKRLFSDGVDVVIGVVEHHGRKETLDLIDGLPILQLTESEHRGIKVREFDIDAALMRKPSLILIDEFAHTNAPSSRHTKRWQDVEELLESGIDVYTTLNVQHLESMNDVVAKFTGIWVQETIPDKIFDAADEISLIDIPSDELLKRLHQGKVYVADGANKLAAENFFKKQNLIALRELALRRTAERVDAQSDEINAAIGKKENAFSQKYLVLIGQDAVSETLLRKTKRMANSSKAPWYALHLRTDRNANLSEKSILRVEKLLQLSEKMGAKIIRLSGNNPAQDILNYAEKHGFTRIIVGHKKRPMLFRFFPSLAFELIESASGIEINIVNQSDEKLPYKPNKVTVNNWLNSLKAYFWSIIIILVCTLIGLPFRDNLDSNVFTVLFIGGIFVIAARYGIWASVFSSIIGVAAYNFFFCHPYYTLDFYEQSSRYTFLLMLITSLFVGSMTARLSRLVKISRKDEQDAKILYELTKGLSSTRGLEAMAHFAKNHLEETTDFEVVIGYYKKNELNILRNCIIASDIKEQSTIDWVIKNQQIAGHGTNTNPSAQALYIPLTADVENIGFIGFIPKSNDEEITSLEIQSLETYSNLIATSFARAKRSDEAALTKIESENEKLRNILLSSLSHDLRTPLTVMNGMVSNILKYRKSMPREAINESIALYQQLERLQKFVYDLLKMASITSGNIKLNQSEYTIEEIVGAAIKTIERQKGKRRIFTSLSGTTPAIFVDGGLIEQVVSNLIENAINYTAEDGEIEVNIAHKDNFVQVSIIDNGNGINEDIKDALFEQFKTSSIGQNDRLNSGTGLGLAICKGIVEAHGGEIRAKNNSNKKGACFSFTLPGIKD